MAKSTHLDQLISRSESGEELAKVLAEIDHQIKTGNASDEHKAEQRKLIREAGTLAAKGMPWADVRTRLVPQPKEATEPAATTKSAKA